MIIGSEKSGRAKEMTMVERNSLVEQLDTCLSEGVSDEKRQARTSRKHVVTCGNAQNMADEECAILTRRLSRPRLTVGDAEQVVCAP